MKRCSPYDRLPRICRYGRPFLFEQGRLAPIYNIFPLNPFLLTKITKNMYPYQRKQDKGEKMNEVAVAKIQVLSTQGNPTQQHIPHAS